MTEAWRNIDWDEIDTGYTYGTHADDSGLVKDQLKSALFDEYEKVLQMHHDRVQNSGVEGSIASAATPDIGAKIENILLVTGTVDITGFVTADAGATRELVFADVLTLTDGATLKIYPSGRRNIITAAGDWAKIRSRGSGNWEVIGYQRADGFPLLGHIQRNGDKDTNLITVTAIIPYDDSPPLIGEGGEVLSVTFVPKYADSIIRCRAIVQSRAQGDNLVAPATLFKDSTAVATSSFFSDPKTSVAGMHTATIVHDEPSVNITSRDYTVRTGPHSLAGALYVNGEASGGGARRFGGTYMTKLEVEEVRDPA